MNIRAAQAADYDAVLTLFPRLAAFELPNGRNPEHLWRSDAHMLQQWAGGERDDCFVQVANDHAGTIVGVVMTSLRPELLSKSPSAHLEAIAVAPAAEGRGIGAALLAAAEQEARRRGARSMSLHVFATNERARRLYERAGFDGELLRYIKRFRDDALS